MVHNFLKILLSIFILSFALHADEGTRVENVKEIRGYGSTKTLAIQNALIEAVKQKNGAFVTSVKKIFKTSSQKYTTNGDKSASLTKMNKAFSNKIKVATSGFIDNYNVINIERVDNEFEAIIQVLTVEYRTPGNSAHKRRKMVIVPSYTENVVFRVLDGAKGSRNVSYNLSQELTNSITQTRKFAILDRANKSAYGNEKAVIVSSDAHKDEILKLGQVLGADYLVVTTIKEFKILKETKKISGQKITKLKAFATVNYQILTMATRQIKWSNTMTFGFKPRGSNNQQIFYSVMKKISSDLTNEIIENIYPIRIAKVSGNGDAILTQSAALGTIYDVYSVGEKLYDPYTKEFLGYDEVQTGTIKITRSLAKVAYGTVIKGHIEPNGICRKSLDQNSKFSQKKKDPNAKKTILVKQLSIAKGINSYKHRYLKGAKIDEKLKSKVSASQKYTLMSRDDEVAQALRDEKELTSDSFSGELDNDSIGYSSADLQLLPKVTKFQLSRTSKKLPDISVYENSDYIKMTLSILVFDSAGKTIYKASATDKYSRSWTSSKKVGGSPSTKNVAKLADKLITKVVHELLRQKVKAGKFITVVEVSDEIVILDLGNNTEVQEGDEYPVYKEPTVKTSSTGKTRLSYGSKIATVRIDGIFEDGVEAVVTKGKISQIKEGYVLRIRKKRK